MLDFPSNGILGGEYFPGYVVDIGADEVLPMYEGICNKPLSIGGGNSNIFWNFHPENWGNGIQFDETYFSNGLVQPPTRISFGSSKFTCI